MPGETAHGTVLEMGDGGTPTEQFSQIDGIVDPKYTPPQPEEEDVTSHSSTAREYAYSGLEGGGKITFVLLYDAADANHVALRGKHGVTTTTNFKLKSAGPVQETENFAALVKVTDDDRPVGKRRRISFELSISGAVT